MSPTAWTAAALFLVLGPFLGGLLTGIDRVLTARMQSRKGPPILQPFYDVLKLWEKDTIIVSRYQTLYLRRFLFFTLVSGVIFFLGGDLLLSLFALTVAGIFLCAAAYTTNSPYSIIGAERELLLMMAYEPMMILIPIGFFSITGSFRVDAILSQTDPMNLLKLAGFFLGFLFMLTIKLRKSPFDLSMSHHGHQELVKGLTTDFSGSDLALVEIGHWYENVILLGWTYLFFAPFGPWIAAPLTLFLFFGEVLIDNTHARLKWGATIKSAWWVTGALGAANLVILQLFKHP